MRKSKKFIGMPVISLAEGQQIGTVRGLVVDPVRQRIAALIIEQKGWFKEQKFAPYGKVHSIGNDAITIDQTGHVEKGNSLPEILTLYKDRINLIGCKVLAENGTQLGMVDEYFVEERTGAIAGLELSGSLLNSLISGRVFLDIGFVRTLGKELVVACNEAIASTVKIDGGLQETVKNLRQNTSQFLESAVQKTKEISSKTKEELESKTKELGERTKDLGGSIKEQLDKVRGNKEPEILEGSSQIEELPPEGSPDPEIPATRAALTEDRVEVKDLPQEVALTREEDLPPLESTENTEETVQPEQTNEEPREDKKEI